jgi:hypothetical protein
MLPISKEKAFIFRICHIDNVPWICENGMHCRSSRRFDPNYRNIGNVDLIAKRAEKFVPITPGGSFNDYIPFYFTSRSPMLLNISTGWNVPKLPMRDIVIFVTSLHKLSATGVDFVFSDRHAYMATARFSSDLAHLDRIDWSILTNSDFKNTPKYPDKKERYQSEALVHRELQMSTIAGIICYSDQAQTKVAEQVEASGYSTKVVTKPQYFF